MRKKKWFKRSFLLLLLWGLLYQAGFLVVVFWAIWFNGGSIELWESSPEIRLLEFISAIIIFVGGLYICKKVAWAVLNPVL